MARRTVEVLCANARLVEKGRALPQSIGSTIPVVTYASRLFCDSFLAWKALYRVALADFCGIAPMAFLQRVHPVEDTLKLNMPAFDPWMRNSVCRGTAAGRRGSFVHW